MFRHVISHLKCGLATLRCLDKNWKVLRAYHLNEAERNINEKDIVETLVHCCNFEYVSIRFEVHVIDTIFALVVDCRSYTPDTLKLYLGISSLIGNYNARSTPITPAMLAYAYKHNMLIHSKIHWRPCINLTIDEIVSWLTNEA